MSDDATLLVPLPHNRWNATAFIEHRQEYIECMDCGAQWAVYGSEIEMLSEGDGYCEDAAGAYEGSFPE